MRLILLNRPTLDCLGQADLDKPCCHFSRGGVASTELHVPAKAVILFRGQINIDFDFSNWLIHKNSPPDILITDYATC